MPVLVLELLKYVLLAVLYIFVWRAVRAVYRELAPQRTRPAGRRAAPPPTARPSPRKQRTGPRKAVVVEGDRKGKSLPLGDEMVIGRASNCNLVLDDTYVSQVHARIYPKDGGRLMVEDLGSTNGTYLNRRRITAPAELQRGDQVKIGKTVMELRK
ncbi:antibiotic biosynthesis regulator FhaB [soil metagenome]